MHSSVTGTSTIQRLAVAVDCQEQNSTTQPTKGVEAPTKPWEKLYDRKTNDLIESYAKGEEQANKLQDIPVDFQLRPKESNRIQAEIEAVEVGKRYAVKQIAEKLGISEYEALEALSTYIDAGKRRGGRTVADFYKWLPEKLTNPVVARPVSDPLEALQTEAKKYGSAEEVVQSVVPGSKVIEPGYIEFPNGGTISYKVGDKELSISGLSDGNFGKSQTGEPTKAVRSVIEWGRDNNKTIKVTGVAPDSSSHSYWDHFGFKDTKNLYEMELKPSDIYNQATTASSSKLQPGKIQSQGQVGLEPSPQATALKTAGSTSQPKTLRQQLKAYQDKKLGVKSTGAVKGTDSSSKVILTRDNKYAFNINKKTLRLDKEASKKMDAVVETMRPVLEKNKGKTLTKQEIVEGGRKAKVLQDVVGRDEAKAFAESLQASRNLLLSESSQVGITPKFLEQLEIVSSTAADAGRRLQSFNIGAEDITIKERVLGDVLKAGATAEEILEAGRKIDWNNAEEITAFYRKFKPATIAEKLDEFRYTNMLSSPNTHINNTFSNFIQTAVLAPVEKTIRGTLSFAESRLTGKEQEYFAGQGIDFAKGYWKSLPDAWTNLKNTISTDSTLTKPDVNLIPTSNSKFRKLYTTPLRALEASDQFFRTLVKGGEMESLKRQGITGAKAAKMAERQADYRTFRQAFDPDGKLGQNKVLQVWDKWNSAIGNLRNVPGGKYLVPFLQTPTNILKQGLEYSPLGFSTVPGASDPMGQLSKAVVGSTVFAGAYAMANSGLTTWDAPTNSTEKSEFYAAGLQPYSVKIGDKWVSYSKLGPLAYPIAMASALKWSKENNGDEGVLTTAGTAMAGTLGFFADQSYVRGIGDIIDAFRGDEYKQARGLGNIPSQMVPYRAFMGWISRLVDPVYRDTAGGSVPEQIGKSIVSQIPYASKSLPARETPFGGESQRQFPGINAVSPFSISQEKPEEKAFYDARKGMRDETKKANKIIKEIEEGSVSGEVDTSKLLGDQAIKVTKKKLEAGMEVTPQELEAVYLSKATSMPSSNRYEKSQRDSELWSKSGSIMDDENLSEAQKQTLQTKIATELGISNQDLDYYQVAKQDVAPKTLYAYDKLDQSKSFDDFMKYLVNGRKPVNGQILVSDGVIDNLVDDGVIPYALGKELKNIDLDSSGKIKSSKGKARGKASTKDFTARKNALNQLGEDLKKVSIGSGKIRATSGSGGKINTKALTFSGR
jgi:urease gamma subunit